MFVTLGSLAWFAATYLVYNEGRTGWAIFMLIVYAYFMLSE